VLIIGAQRSGWPRPLFLFNPVAPLLSSTLLHDHAAPAASFNQPTGATRKRRGVKEDVVANPVQVGFLSAVGIVFERGNVAELIEEFRLAGTGLRRHEGFHERASLAETPPEDKPVMEGIHVSNSA
jgi:hypothetical protein